MFVTEIRATAVSISKAQSIRSRASRLSRHEAAAVNFTAFRCIGIATQPYRRQFPRGRALPSTSPPGRPCHRRGSASRLQDWPLKKVNRVSWAVTRSSRSYTRSKEILCKTTGSQRRQHSGQAWQGVCVNFS